MLQTLLLCIKQVKIQLIINGLVIYLSEAWEKTHLFQIMSISFYMNVYTSINSETSHFLFIIWQCVNGTQFPFRLSFLRIHNSFRIHPYGLKISGDFFAFLFWERDCEKSHQNRQRLHPSQHTKINHLKITFSFSREVRWSMHWSGQPVMLSVKSEIENKWASAMN